MDDGTIIGRTHDVLAAYDVISVEGPAFGLHINAAKCELWWPTQNVRMDEFSAAIKRLDSFSWSVSAWQRVR